MKPQQQEYFDNFPEVDEFHFTADGIGWKHEPEARAHAVGLFNTTVERIKRPKAVGEAPEVKVSPEPVETPEPEATIYGKKPAPKKSTSKK